MTTWEFLVARLLDEASQCKSGTINIVHLKVICLIPISLKQYLSQTTPFFSKLLENQSQLPRMRLELRLIMELYYDRAEVSHSGDILRLLKPLLF